MTNVRPVFVDLDGTLIDKPSTEKRFVIYLLRRRIIGPKQWLSAAAFFIRYGRIFGRNVARKNKAYLHDIEVERVCSLARSFARQELLPCLRPFVVRRLQQHHQAGDQIILLTGAPAFLAEPLAAAIGAQAVIATSLAIADGRFTSAPPLRHPFAESKVDAALGFCLAAGVRLAECTAYADSVHDLPLLALVGSAIAVTPDAGLRTAAWRHGWEIVEAEHAAADWPAPDRLSASD